jgi:hypothetical protein
VAAPFTADFKIHPDAQHQKGIATTGVRFFHSEDIPDCNVQSIAFLSLFSI